MDEGGLTLKGYTGCKFLGRGTQGSVFKAYTISSSKTSVAIKVISKNSLSKTGRDNLVTEIGLLKKIKHKFIVDLLDFHWDDKYIYIVMEFCGGGDLSTVIKQRKCLSEQTCRRFVQQLASALQYLRQNNVSHMDLKPSNLLVTSSNPPILKVADFGFAQHLEENSKDRGLKGSPLYMAPEIFLSDEYDAKADLWSIGVILYEGLFGKAPFSSDTLESLVVKIKEDVPIIIPRSRKISSECRDLLSRCLVRCPEKRIAFQDFFSHPFLDLEHLPDDKSFQKASKLVNQAVVADRDKDAEKAIRLYEESLKYFNPLVYYESDMKKKEKLRSTVSGYQKRCQELKQRSESSGSRDKQSRLVALCRTSSNLMTGVEICVQAEDYLAGGEIDMALDRLTAGLGVLVPALQQEPKGTRRDILKEEITNWMNCAERLKRHKEDDSAVVKMATTSTNVVENEDATETANDDTSGNKNSCKLQ